MSTGQTMSRAERYRQRRQEGSLWTAPSGEEIRIRKLSMIDHAVVGQLPDNLQQIVYRAIDASTKLRAAPSPDDLDIDDVFGDLDGNAKLEAMRDTSIRLAKIGWLDPKLVDDVSDPETEIGVNEVEADDLIAYMGYVMGGQQSEANALSPFPERPRDGVGSGSTRTEVQPASQPDHRANAAILSRDSV